VKAFCQLTPKQAALYQQAVAELAEKLERSEGIQRRGVILAFLMRFQADLQSSVALAGRRRLERSR